MRLLETLTWSLLSLTCLPVKLTCYGRALERLRPSARQLAPEPAAVEALDVGQEVVYHRISRRQRLDLELASAGGAVVLAQLLQARVGARHPRVDLEHLPLALAHVHDGVHLPVAGVRAEVGSPVAPADHRALIAAATDA